MTDSFVGELVDCLVEQLEVEGLFLCIAHREVFGLLAILLVGRVKGDEEAGMGSFKGEQEGVMPS